MNFPLQKWRPRREVEFKTGEIGSYSTKVRTPQGIVEFFSTPDCAYCKAFTVMEMWLSPYQFIATVKRNYPQRWAVRLSNAFAKQCAAAPKR